MGGNVQEDACIKLLQESDSDQPVLLSQNPSAEVSRSSHVHTLPPAPGRVPVGAWCTSLSLLIMRAGAGRPTKGACQSMWDETETRKRTSTAARERGEGTLGLFPQWFKAHLTVWRRVTQVLSQFKCIPFLLQKISFLKHYIFIHLQVGVKLSQIAIHLIS